MKTVRIFAMSAIVAAVAAFPVYAQGTRPTPSPTPAASRPAVPPAANTASVAVPDAKIAFINTDAFPEEKTGINRFINAVGTLQRDLKPKQEELQGLQTKIRQVATDIENLQKATVVAQSTIQTKQEE